MDRLKIYVFGYSHCGTTILRKVIGDHSLVDEVTWEIFYPPEFKKKPHIVFKAGGIPGEVHKDCKRVMIMKNPWDVFGSLAKRKGDEFSGAFGQLLQRYVGHLQYFDLETDDYKVRYEDLFDGGLEGVFDYLGLDYEGPTLRKSAHELPPGADPNKASQEAMNTYRLRTAQINGPFEDMTGRSAPYLEGYYARHFNCYPIIKAVYGDFEHLGDRGR